MQAGGVIKSDAVRHPLQPLHPATRAGLLELAKERDALALRWEGVATRLSPGLPAVPPCQAAPMWRCGPA